MTLTMLVSPAAAASERHETRALTAYATLDRYFGTADGSGLYREQYPAAAEDNPYSYEWPYSQVHIAALDLTVAHPRGEGEYAARAAAQEHYWNAAGGTTGRAGYDSYPVAPYGAGGDMFYDDNEWVGLAKIQRYLQTRDAAALRRAKEIFALVESGWDTDTSHSAPGGVFWTQATWSHDRNTVSNMPGAELGIRLYQITGQRRYLQSALRFYDWTNTYLQSPSGLYWDHLDLDGTLEKTIWSYNQGVPIGVNVLLYQVTRDRTYLRRAERIADAAYDYYVTQGRLNGQPIFFNSIFFKNLLLLQSVTGGDRYRQAMARYADWVWSAKRDPRTGLVHFSTDGRTQVIEQAALVQIYAVLAWPRAKWPILY
ncbi:glycoside hydrolase family 76 protein [Actinoplanes sp. NPDC049265]|uniref:glycoside hydrolase family 76 protein n=1 Tax=Actinoplanes sp. NPDC049265 TaxID=3363902 RepID=UPI0037171C49